MAKANFCHSNWCLSSSQLLLQQYVSPGTFARNGSSQRSITTLLEIMNYEDHAYSKIVRNILKEALLEAAPLDAALIANTRARTKKILVSMERDKHGKSKNAHMVSVEEAINLMQ